MREGEGTLTATPGRGSSRGFPSLGVYRGDPGLPGAAVSACAAGASLLDELSPPLPAEQLALKVDAAIGSRSQTTIDDFTTADA